MQILRVSSLKSYYYFFFLKFLPIWGVAWGRAVVVMKVGNEEQKIREVSLKMTVQVPFPGGAHV